VLWTSPISTLFPYTTLFRSYGKLQYTGEAPCLAVRNPSFSREPGTPTPEVTGPNSRSVPKTARPPRTLYRTSCNACGPTGARPRSEEHTSELQSRFDLVCRL